MQSRMFAIASAEAIRPLFTRWASDGARDVYEVVMRELSTGGVPPVRESLARIDALPEAHYDDSHHRDIYLMLGLGVLHYAVRIVGGADDLQARRDREELDAVLDSLFGDMKLSESVSELKQLDEGSIPGVLRVGRQFAQRVDVALDSLAKLHGWPPNRLRR